MQERLVKIRRAIAILRKQLGRMPDLDEIASESRLDASQVMSALKSEQCPLSLDKAFGLDEESPLVNNLTDFDAVDPEDEAEASLLKQVIGRALLSLKPQEKAVLEMRFGLNDGVVRSLEYCCERLCVSRERIRQIEKKALSRLARDPRWVAMRDFLN
jgi:RNA polymerase sigma factor (sigma-70 family)